MDVIYTYSKINTNSYRIR